LKTQIEESEKNRESFGKIRGKTASLQKGPFEIDPFVLLRSAIARSKRFDQPWWKKKWEKKGALKNHKTIQKGAFKNHKAI